jgi:hypothetical protein
VQHLGDVRPFTHTNSKFQKLSKPSENRLNQPKIEQIRGSNPDGAVVFTENKKEQQSSENIAAASLIFPKEKKELTVPNQQPELLNLIKFKNPELNKNLRQELKFYTNKNYFPPTAESLNINSDNSQPVDVVMPYTPEQIGLISKPPQKLVTEVNSLNNPTISATKPIKPTNKGVPLSFEISSPVTPQISEIVKAVGFTNHDATEIIEAVPVANPDVTEIVEEVPIANPETIEIVEAVRIAHPDVTEIVEAVTRATGGMNPELKICVLQHSLSEIQATINLLQLRSQTKQISNPSGWIVDCLRGRWWEKTNNFHNSSPTNIVSSPTPTNSSAQIAKITEDYIDPQYMPLNTHRELCEQFQKLGKEGFRTLGIQQQIYLQWMQKFPEQLKRILSKLSTT